MRKMKVLGVFLGGLMVLAWAFAGTAGALSFDDQGRFQLGGYLENFTGIRLSDHTYPGGEEVKAGDFEMFRNTVFLDLSARFSDEVQFKVIGRGYYDDVYSLNDGPDAPKDQDQWAGPSPLAMKQDFDFREYYLTYSADNLVVRAGRMQVVWGESDALRMADVINPLDISWYWSFPSWEEIRIPLHMIQAVYNVPDSPQHLKLEAVFNPGDFRTWQIAPYSATWDPGLPPEPVFTWIKEQAEHDLPDRDISNSSGGGRIKAQFGEWDTSVFVYYQRWADPAMGLYVFDPVGALRPNEFPFRFVYPYITTLGGTFNYPVLGAILRGECAFNLDEPFRLVDPVSKPGEYGENNTLSFMLGFDQNSWFKFLNPGKSFFISGQWFQKFLLSADDGLVTGLGDQGLDNSQTIFSLLVNTEYYDGIIKPEALGVWSLTEECGFVDFHVAYEPTFVWRFTLGILQLWGNEYNAGVWGGIQDNSQVYGKIRWSF